MKFKHIFLIVIYLTLISGTAFAHPWFQTEKPLKIGDRDGVCEVVAQLDLGPGSQPLITSKAQNICEEMYKSETQNSHAIKALMNGDTQVVNCFICASSN